MDVVAITTNEGTKFTNPYGFRCLWRSQPPTPPSTSAAFSAKAKNAWVTNYQAAELLANIVGYTNSVIPKSQQLWLHMCLEVFLLSLGATMCGKAGSPSQACALVICKLCAQRDIGTTAAQPMKA
eukprot:3899278-Amphidinium_carterae.1